MSLDIHTIHEIASSGSDSNPGIDTNGGGFNPVNANPITNLTATGGTGATPVISSASYNFVAADVAAWAFIQSGASWTLPNVTFGGVAVTPVGLWVKVSSVASNAATLDAAVGHVVCYDQGGPYALNTTAGIATTASPSTGSLLMDYSQTGTPRVSVTDGVTAGTTTITSATAAFSLVMPGNLIYVQGGTGSDVAGVYEVVSRTNATTIVVDRSTGLTSGTGVTLHLGGCLASLGQAGANHIGGNKIFLKGNAIYSVASATQNVATGTYSPLAGTSTNWTVLAGYASFRSDNPVGSTRPIIKATINSALSLTTLGAQTRARCFILDCNSGTSVSAFGTSQADSSYEWVTVKNMSVGGAATPNATALFCDSTACATPLFAANSPNVRMSYCVAWSNTASGFSGAGAFIRCISVNNSGTSDGFANLDIAAALYQSCLARGNGRDGWRLAASTGGVIKHLLNCISYGNTGVGINATSSTEGLHLFWCAVGNNSTNISTNIGKWQQISTITLTADPHTNSAGGDYSLNNTAGGGALLRGNVGAIGAFPGLSTTSYEDIGPVQHQDSGGAAGIIPCKGLTGGLAG